MISPLHDKILIQEDQEKEKKVGNILVPDSASAKNYCTGTVLAAGAGRYQNGALIPPSVKQGDRVIYMKYAANTYREDGKVMIRDEELLGVINAN